MQLQEWLFTTKKFLILPARALERRDRKEWEWVVLLERELSSLDLSTLLFEMASFTSLELAKQARLAGSTCLHLPGTGIPTAPHQTQLLKGRVLCSFGTNTLLTELFPQLTVTSLLVT